MLNIIDYTLIDLNLDIPLQSFNLDNLDEKKLTQILKDVENKVKLFNLG